MVPGRSRATACPSKPKADDGHDVKTALRSRARDGPSAPGWHCRSHTTRMHLKRVQKLHMEVRDLLFAATRLDTLVGYGQSIPGPGAGMNADAARTRACATSEVYAADQQRVTLPDTRRERTYLTADCMRGTSQHGQGPRKSRSDRHSSSSRRRCCNRKRRRPSRNY